MKIIGAAIFYLDLYSLYFLKFCQCCDNTGKFMKIQTQNYFKYILRNGLNFLDCLALAMSVELFID